MARTRRAVRRDPDEALVASITRAEGRHIDLGQAQQRPWQAHAWLYWGRLGELMFPTNQLAKIVAHRIDWNVSIDGVQLERTIDDTPDDVDAYIDAVTSGIGRAEALRLLSLNLQVPAECWYVHQGDDAGWNVYSIIDPLLKEIREHEDWLRLHVKVVDPRDQQFAISPFSAIIGPAEDLLTLEALSRSQSRSRIAQAGILLRPQEAHFPTTDPDTGEQVDPFPDDLMEAMTQPIADEHDPSALVPLDLEVPGDTVEQFRHLTFSREYDEQLPERMDRAIKRIATGLDIPAELLLGMGDINHWGQWLIQEETYRSHVEPLAGRVGEVLAEAGEALLDRPEGSIKVTPDPSRMLARRSTVRDAIQAASIFAVGLRYVREAIGAEEKDAPTDEEIALMLAARGGQPGVPGLPGARRAPRVPDGGAGDDVEPEPDIGPPEDDDAPVAATLVAAIDPAAATADDLERFGNDLAAIDMQLRDTLTGAMAIAVAAARNRVGAKIRTTIRSTPEHDQIVDTDNSNVAARLGARAFELVDPEPVVRDTIDRDLAVWWQQQLTAARARLSSLAGIDTTGLEWKEAAAASGERLVDGLTAWTVAELTRTDAAMSAMPTDLAREVVAAAGGS